jgi:hypothetical protein
MILLLAAALVVLSIGVLLYPFLRDCFQPEANESQQGPVPVIDDVEDVLDAIRTLQLEFQLGNVPEKQYREELRAYRMQAAAKLRDQMESQTQDANLELEQEVLMARLGVRGDGADRMCPACGAALQGDAGTCTACGAGPSAAEGNSAIGGDW